MASFKPFKVAADVVIREGPETLMVKEKKEGFEGLWGLPGGGVDDDETPREAAKRELKEEAGLDIEVGDLIGIYILENKSIGEDVLVFIYEAERNSGGMEVEFTDEIESVEFVDLDEIDEQELRDPELTRIVVENYASGRGFGQVEDLR